MSGSGDEDQVRTATGEDGEHVLFHRHVEAGNTVLLVSHGLRAHS
jgi:hypothetical protein